MAAVVELRSSWYNIKGDPKGFANVWMSRATPRFLPFTEVGKTAVDVREHGHLKFGFGCFKLQMPFRYKANQYRRLEFMGAVRVEIWMWEPEACSLGEITRG